MSMSGITRAAIKWRDAKIQLSAAPNPSNHRVLTEAQLSLEKMIDDLMTSTPSIERVKRRE